MMPYIMDGKGETERLAFKTDPARIQRHLAWTGLRPGQSFVDIGCGTGDVAAAAAHINGAAPVIGIDAAESRLAHARNACDQQSLLNAQFHLARVDGLGSSGFADDQFDHAWTRFFLEYHPAPLVVVREMTRIVRPGGKVTLIDIEGNGTWHKGMAPGLRRELDEIIADLATTGFDPDSGRKLAGFAKEAGLANIRHAVEPYHRINGRPSARSIGAWQRKIEGIRDNYTTWLFPHKAHKAWVFDAFLGFLSQEETSTWSVLHLVQGTKPDLASPMRSRRLSGNAQRPSRAFNQPSLV